jgi:dihydroorotate dehydrogenase
MDMISSLLRHLPPERAHRLAIAGLKLGLGPAHASNVHPDLATTLFGLTFPNPVGLAAGFDKNAEAPDALLRAGFGFVEIGTVTPLPQQGNPRPRLFRDDDAEAIVNRMGFNGEGLDVFEARMRRRTRAGIVGANVGRNKLQQDAEADYVTCIRRLADVAEYLTINISSPNTPGLRGLQEPAALDSLLRACTAARDEVRADCPLLVKIAPDLDEAAVEAIVGICVDRGIAGLIVGNTTLSRPSGLDPAISGEAGGLSGRPLFTLSTDILRVAYRYAKGRLPLIGVGGISSADDAWAKILAGANLVQVYSGMIFHGPHFAHRIVEGLAERLRRSGHRTLAEAVGTGA